MGSVETPEFKAFQASFGAWLMGSRTYEPFHEPAVDSFSGMGTSCRVFSKRQLRASGSSVTITSKSPAELVEELASLGIQRAWLMRGGRLASSFRSANLITESALGVIPVILGSGVPLFESTGQSTRLKLLESRAEPNEVVQWRYRAE